MIQWLLRTDPERPFLKTTDRVWTYGQSLAEITARVGEDPVTLTPSLDPESVFELLAGMVGGGARVTSPLVTVLDNAGMDGAALVVFTSGTSGVPKGVRLTTGNLKAAAAASVSHLGHDERDTWLLAMPLGHVGGLSILVRSAFAGGSVRLLSGFDLASFSEAMRGDVTMVSVVPTMLHRLLDEDPGPYRNLRAVLVGGGPIPEGLLERAVDAGLPVLPTYGMTETFGQIATLRPGAPVERKVHPLPGVELRIEPDTRIAIRSDQVSPGYLGEPDREDEWFVTSDLGEIDAEGALRVHGRADTVIVTGGENVDPARVEAEITAHSRVEEAVVVGIPDPVWGHIVGVVYAGEVDGPELMDAVEATLPDFMNPRRWVRVDAIRRTPLGKPDRQAALVLLLDITS